MSMKKGELFISLMDQATYDDFTVSKKGREGESVPWTLGNYLQASALRYPLRARVLCVCPQRSAHAWQKNLPCDSKAVGPKYILSHLLHIM